MRWLSNKKPPPEGDQVRWRKVFAWKRTDVGRHVVWLEWYWVVERFHEPASGSQGWWSEYARHIIPLS